MRRTVALLSAVMFMIGILAGPAMAHHQHTLKNPGTSKTFACEPPAAVGVHPIHNGLHMALDPRHVDATQDRWRRSGKHNTHPGGIEMSTEDCP